MPAFLFIFAGAPFIERAGTHPRLNHALSAVTAASELAEIHLEDDDWYGLLLTSTTVNDQMSAAAWMR